MTQTKKPQKKKTKTQKKPSKMRQAQSHKLEEEEFEGESKLVDAEFPSYKKNLSKKDKEELSRREGERAL